MKPAHPCTCEKADCSATLQPRSMRVRRGDRSLTTTGYYWCCTSCTDPITGGPLEMVDRPLAQFNDSIAGEAWKNTFGEPLPVRQLPGRKPEEAMEERVVFLLTRSELAQLDAVRGAQSRSDFIRTSLRQQLQKAG